MTPASWPVHRGELVLEVPIGVVRDALFHAADMIARDGWEPSPGGEKRPGPRNVHTAMGDACASFRDESGEVQIWQAARAAVLELLQVEHGARSLDEFEWQHGCTAEMVGDLLVRAGERIDPTPRWRDEDG